MIAIIESGNKQYMVKKGDVIKVDRIDSAVGDKLSEFNVLSAGAKVGAPFLKDAKVSCEVLYQTRCDKIIVFKKKRRQNYRRKLGHRQNISVLRVLDIAS